jgi:hypothetical protein
VNSAMRENALRFYDRNTLVKIVPRFRAVVERVLSLDCKSQRYTGKAARVMFFALHEARQCQL